VELAIGFHDLWFPQFQHASVLIQRNPFFVIRSKRGVLGELILSSLFLCSDRFLHSQFFFRFLCFGFSLLIFSTFSSLIRLGGRLSIRGLGTFYWGDLWRLGVRITWSWHRTLTRASRSMDLSLNGSDHLHSLTW
jgi:hypothetical protein